MDPIKSYFTKEGWKKDFQKTREDFANMYKSSKLDDLVRNESGDVAVAALVATVAMPVCAYVGSYVGEGLGWVGGNIIDFIPYVNDVAPWLIERSGLINDAKTAVDLNENLYQTTGAISGFWVGLWLPWKVSATYMVAKKSAPFKV